ncbi:MAG TPA: DUF1570 domain-containing protein [Gemmataceae bacterium]|nr:DUF1570 domain-containing protein [Gemmataceae bacterium]
MHLALALCLAASLPTDAAPNDNLDFRGGTLAGWEGDGFVIAPAGRHGPTLECAVCSSDRGPEPRTAMIHRTVTVPHGAGVLRFTAHAVRGKNCAANDNLDVILMAPGRRVLPKQVRKGAEWQPAGSILPAENGRPREYVWDVRDWAGQALRVALIDEDKRRDCFLVCGGFRFVAADEFDGREFGRFMHHLTAENKLGPAARFESRHFIAYSNADDEFAVMRLNNCELIYDLFFEHFRKKGFRVREPATKLMVAVFDSQAGMEAYVGQRMPTAVTGLYHPKSNRLVVYDYGHNRDFEAAKRQARVDAHRIGSDLDRRRFIDTVNRRASEFRTEANIGTVMHEVAHQLAFNCGLHNRDGDTPFWLAEGLATYCEATENGAWQGIGETNPERITPLIGPTHGQGGFIRLRDLMERDDWMKDTRTALMAYAQSWALFKMLMEERPAQLRKFIELNNVRRTGDHRPADFAAAFGVEVERMELRYLEFMKEQVERYHPTRK